MNLKHNVFQVPKGWGAVIRGGGATFRNRVNELSLFSHSTGECMFVSVG